MGEMMTFPETIQEFLEQYKIVDTEQVYTNGAELVPIFRVLQWYDAHITPAKPQTNADKYFRNATDDMIAEWIAKHMYCAECMFFNDDNGTCKYEQRYRKGCNGAMLDWLKQEVVGDA